MVYIILKYPCYMNLTYLFVAGEKTDEGNPQQGVIVKMSSSKCSISVFIFCDSAAAQVSRFFQVNIIFRVSVSVNVAFLFNVLLSSLVFQLPDKFSQSGYCDYVGTHIFSQK